MAGVIAAVLHTSLDVIERWPPDKTLRYYDTAVEIHQMMNGRATVSQADQATENELTGALGFEL